MRGPSQLVRDLAYRAASGALSSLGVPRSPSLVRPELAFVLPVSDDVHNFMTALQIEVLKRQGVNDALVAPPHITMKLGFEAADLRMVADYLGEVASTTPPFEITMGGIRSFGDGVIYMGVEPTESLDDLRRKIVDDLRERFQIEPRLIEGDQFRFHATLAYGLSAKGFEQELSALSRPTPSFHFQAQSLAMFCHIGRHWVTYRRVALGARDRVS